jgi:Cu(I)/Ag(I) efflux system membrane fusion protein
MVRTIRAVGTVQADERRDTTIALKFDGWIDRLLVNTTGERVSRGQALMDVYSPELLSAQREYLIARQADALPSGSQSEPAGSNVSLATATAERLRNWGIDETILARLEAGAAPQRTLRITSPVTGIVIEKTAVQGARFMAGEALYRIADLRKVWVIARVFEQDLAAVRVGQSARVRVDAYPAREFGGLVAFIYPTVDPQTRSVSARIALDNQDYLLKPEMFVNVEFGAPEGAPAVLAVPPDAVIDTGRSHHVLVQRAAGEFVPREVALGQRGDAYVEIRSGLEPGEIVVTGANFLIDSESNLRAAFESLGHSAH